MLTTVGTEKHSHEGLKDIMPKVCRWVPFLLIICVGAVHGAVKHLPIKSSIVLKPGEAYTVHIETAKPVEIGWRTVQVKPCTTNCIQATELSGSSHFSFATSLGGSYVYEPTSGRISVEYKNVSQESVAIDIFRIHRICGAEACQFLDSSQKGRWLVFKVEEFKSIATSKDGSYSVISGVAVSGRAFRIRAVWWTDDKTAALVNCSPFIKKYTDSHTPKEQYRPYVISGQAVGDGRNIVLKSIDTCAPQAAHFGVPEQNVFQ
jgi:hypothetical protein